MRVGVAIVAVLAALAGSASAQAQTAPLPTENLVREGDEGPLVSPEGYDYLPGSFSAWGKNPYDSGIIPVLYGAPGFPSKELSAEITGGKMFIAGGPSRPGDDNSARFTDTLAYQVIQFPDAALPWIRTAAVQITVSACLGGYAEQNDYVSIDGFPRRYGEDRLPNELVVNGPNAIERDNKTDLLPRSTTAAVYSGATVYTIGLHFHRTSGVDTYNDGYADKISARLSMAGSKPPAPDCTAPKSSPGDPPRKPTPRDPDDGTNTAAPITRGSKRVTFGKRYATFRLHCVAHDTACKGRATLKTKASKVGSSRFRIATGKTGKVKVKLGRRWRARVAHLSVRRFARLKLTAVVKIGREKTSFGFGAVR